MPGPQASKVLLELDALIDTRLGTLNIIDAEAVQTMNPAAYFLRTNDTFDFMNIDAELFNIAYAGRDELTLRNSMITGILPIVQNAIHQFNSYLNPNVKGPHALDLNIWPYKLDAEGAQVVADLLEFKLGGVVKVSIVNFAPNQLTLGYLRNNYHTVVMYDWVRWACAIEESFRNEQAPGVTLIAPDLLQGKPLPENPDKLTQAAFKAGHPTAYMEFALADSIGLSFERVIFFCMAH